MELGNYKQVIADRVKSAPKHTSWWQAFGKELSEFFGVKRPYWIFWKYPEHVIRYGYSVCRENGCHSFQYFIGILKNEHARSCHSTLEKTGK